MATIEAPQETENTLDRVPDLTGRTLLVVDDNATNRAILGRFLRATGACICFAETGGEAIEMFAAERHDLVLMDIQMPGMTGIEATRQILRQARKQNLPPPQIIAVTANVLAHQVEEYIAAGMSDVLPKPISKKTLMALLNRQVMMKRIHSTPSVSAQAG